jgi:hypothetical protein
VTLDDTIGCHLQRWLAFVREASHLSEGISNAYQRCPTVPVPPYQGGSAGSYPVGATIHTVISKTCY